MNIPASLADLAVPLEELRPYGRNARRGNVAGIADSLRVHGQYRPVVGNRRTGEVLAGSHTLEAARSLGWTHLAVSWVDVDEDQAARIVLVDNKSNDDAGYDEALLAELLAELPDLTGTGWSQQEFDALLAEVTVLPDPLADPDEAPAPPTEAVSVLGDVWLLGRHRLVCGDATDVGVYDTLLGENRANLVWTDPPYGVSYQTDLSPEEARRLNRRTDGLTVSNDTLTAESLQDFLSEAFGAAMAHCRGGACWYVASPSGPQFLDFAVVLRDMDIWRQTLVWVKDVFAFGRSDYHYRHESIFYGWIPGEAHHAVPDRTQDTVWEIARPKKSPEHPTMKPVELIERALTNSSSCGDLVLDPFGGSGSTLIAAHTSPAAGRG